MHSYFTALNHLVIWGTLALYFVVMTVAQTIKAFEFYYVMDALYTDINFWAIIVVRVPLCLPHALAHHWCFSFVL